MISGFAAFGNSLFTLMGLSYASEFGINAGIAGVLYPLSTIFVAIIARIAYEEHIQRIQLLGMIVIFSGATVIAMFPAEDEEGKKATPKEFAIVLGINLTCTICVTIELITARLLSERGVDGKYIGLNSLVVTGSLGTISLIVATCMGSGIYATGLDGLGLMVAAAFFGVISSGLVKYAIAVGVAAVVSSIYNLNPAILAAMAYFFLS